MNSFLRKLITEWRRLELPFNDAVITVAVSGGADSVSLLLALAKLREMKKLNLSFIAAHFNHELRGEESQKDEFYVENLAKKLHIDYIAGKPETELLAHRGNLEQIARQERYRFLEKTAITKQSSVVLTAHTLNDQAETFLLNLLRGSGLEGLSAMNFRRNISADSGVQLIRPLMNWAQREDTESFCREMRAEFRKDAMNQDLKFSRVRIRKELIPLLKTFNPKVIDTLAQTANLLREDALELAENDAETTSELSVKVLQTLPKAALYRLLRKWIAAETGSLRRIELKHLRAIENLIASTKSGRIVEVPGNKDIIKSKGKLFFENSKVEKTRCDH